MLAVWIQKSFRRPQLQLSPSNTRPLPGRYPLLQGSCTLGRTTTTLLSPSARQRKVSLEGMAVDETRLALTPALRDLLDHLLTLPSPGLPSSLLARLQTVDVQSQVGVGGKDRGIGHDLVKQLGYWAQSSEGKDLLWSAQFGTQSYFPHPRPRKMTELNSSCTGGHLRSRLLPPPLAPLNHAHAPAAVHHPSASPVVQPRHPHQLAFPPAVNPAAGGRVLRAGVG